jgi:adenylate kinase family enzyme
MIIHIEGASGSGKSTIGLKIKKNIKSKNILVIDTDDILDLNVLDVLKKYKLKKKGDFKEYDKNIKKRINEDTKKILEDNKEKNIIFVGFLHYGMKFLEKKIDKGFMIKIDSEVLWRQYNLRTLNMIKNNIKEIEELISNNKIEINNINEILFSKFGIRSGLYCWDHNSAKKIIKNMKIRSKINNYYYGTNNKIYDKIIKLLK